MCYLTVALNLLWLCLSHKSSTWTWTIAESWEFLKSVWAQQTQDQVWTGVWTECTQLEVKCSSRLGVNWLMIDADNLYNRLRQVLLFSVVALSLKPPEGAVTTLPPLNGMSCTVYIQCLLSVYQWRFCRSMFVSVNETETPLGRQNRLGFGSNCRSSDSWVRG